MIPELVEGAAVTIPEPVEGPLRPGADTVRLRVLGIGMGPQHVTAEVAEALRGCDYVVAFDKSSTQNAHGGSGTDPLVEVRAAICAQQQVELVRVPDPERDRNPDDYRTAVASWHEARCEVLASVLRERGGTAGLLAWGDPALYDSSVRLAQGLSDRMELDWDVLPGISAPQLLAAKHRIVLNEVGGGVHITTARRLRDDIAAGQRNLVVMLGGDPELEGLEEWTIWWGANLGAPGEHLVHGRVGEVAGSLAEARATARGTDGWVMDLCLLRGPR